MKVIKVSSQHDLFSVINIRKEVFIIEQGVSVSEELDQLDYDATHFLLMNNEQPIATARLVEFDDYYLLGRIAVLKAYRMQGAASFLIKEIIHNYCEDKLIHLGAQEQAIGFYEKIGFKVVGDVYDDAGIRHFPMEMIKSVTSKI